jgi:hypothetical protein
MQFEKLFKKSLVSMLTWLCGIRVTVYLAQASVACCKALLTGSQRYFLNISVKQTVKLFFNSLLAILAAL